MKFQVISHAGLVIEHNNVSIICDPWVLGSCYWRSWWNYPPVTPELIASLKPDYIYLTHVHWDHFQGPSLKLWGMDIGIIIPLEPCGRMKRDLEDMGFTNIIEIDHCKSLELADDFKITCYHFGLFLDSCIVVEGGGITLFNANDTKIMGGPLKEVISNHSHFDFVFRSHSSANSRLCYEIIDNPQALVDDLGKYVSDFSAFSQAVNATYAIPFASNACYLHKDTYHFNDTGVTPKMVEEYFVEQGIDSPILKVMVTGDSWSQEDGFNITEQTFFDERERHLQEYQQSVQDKLDKTYEREERAKINPKQVERYFSRVFDLMPGFFRRLYKNNPILYVLNSGETQYLFEVDLYNKVVAELDSYTDDSHPIQVHTNTSLMKHCMQVDLFSHLAISKRVKYRVRSDKKKLMERLNLFNNFFEYDYFPLHKNINGRFIFGWIKRWREIILYAAIFLDLARGKGLHFVRYLPQNNLSSSSKKSLSKA